MYKRQIEYRLTGQATAPAAIEDTRCALIYIISHAKELNVDVNKIVIMGGSSGAVSYTHLDVYKRQLLPNLRRACPMHWYPAV